MPSRSGHELLPHLNILEHHLLHREELENDRYRSRFYDLELLPYVLGAAWHAVEELAAVQYRLAEEHRDALKPRMIQVLGPEARDEMTYAVDAFLEAARRTLNALIPYFRHGLGISLPPSMHRLVKQLRAGRVELPDRLAANLDSHWTQHGERLKAYRDVSQHHALVTSDARLFLAGDRVAMYFVLPSNPEAKFASELVFGSPPVHTLQYVVDEFLALAIFVHWATAGLVSRTLRTRFAVSVFRDGVTLRLDGNVVLTPDEFGRNMNRLRTALTDQAKAMGL